MGETSSHKEKSICGKVTSVSHSKAGDDEVATHVLMEPAKVGGSGHLGAVWGQMGIAHTCMTKICFPVALPPTLPGPEARTKPKLFNTT